MKKPKQQYLQTWKLGELIQKGSIDLEAPYQRGIVWGPQKMSDLIDSVLFNYYIPPLVFATRKVNNKMVRTCVDGKQRLTSITRFTNNEIPYYDRSVDPPITKYFSPEADLKKPNGEVLFAGRQYLSDEELMRFNGIEIGYVDYINLSEDEEYDVFSRVQMGVQISPAEKLRAHNTAIAKKVRELAETYRDVSQILPSLGNLATLFKTIAELFLCLDTEPDAFNLTSTKVASYIKSTGVLKASVVEKAERALQLLTKMINYHSSFRALTRYPAQLKKPMVKIELLTILYYLSNCSENHSLDVLADDCSDMRKMFHNWDQRLYLGARSWALGVNWCKDKWRENQAQSNNSFSLDNDPMTFDLGRFLQTDDLNLAPQSQYLFNPSQLNQFEHRTSQHTRQLSDDEVDTPVQQPLAGSSRRRSLNRPVARRGGKIPRLH